MRRLFEFFCGLCALFAIYVPTLGQNVLIRTDTTIGPFDTSIGTPPVPLRTASIVVEGCTLTMSGRHSIRSLVLRHGAGFPSGRSAALTHAPASIVDYSNGAGTDVVSGLELWVDEDLLLDSTSGIGRNEIRLTGRGWPAEQGPSHGQSSQSSGGGGGGHAGAGGGSSGRISGGAAVPFDPERPRFLGSGGGRNVSTNEVGGPGGGVLALFVRGTLSILGSSAIVADGSDGDSRTAICGALCTPTSKGGGGGAGGSIFIQTRRIVGPTSMFAVAVSASGGSSSNLSCPPATRTGSGCGGAGGGGAIAIRACTLDMNPGAVRASAGGSASGSPAQPGSVRFLADPADFNRSGQVDFFDYLDFVVAFEAQTPDADFNRSGQVDFFDYLDFIAAFDDACP